MTRSFSFLRTAAVVFAAFAALMLMLTSCSSSQDDAANSTTSASGDSTGTINVFAAASLKNVGDELAEAFVADGHEGVKIEFNYAGSSKLVQQIEQGATADLFISADEKNMEAATELDEFAGAEPQIIATNRLVLATAPGNPGSIVSLEQLKTDPELRIAVCADGVPCGTLAHEYLDEAGVTLTNPTEEANVSDVSTKVATGEVDAGFIYSTDAKAMEANQKESDGEITVLDLPGVEENKYPAALTNSGQENQVAKEFLEWLQSDRAREILAKYGFGFTS